MAIPESIPISTPGPNGSGFLQVSIDSEAMHTGQMQMKSNCHGLPRLPNFSLSYSVFLFAVVRDSRPLCPSLTKLPMDCSCVF